ncbi:MAG TPA: N-acetyltransferase [Trebonia sp.]|jgi:ribosomal protein S18 acetylase RimI-like enzyme|nr:N-acetyltransferase [Trebonia sp.]
MIVVHEVTADDWELMRDVRLAALAEAPSAFGSSYAWEVAFTEEQWRGRISERSVTFFAREEPAGSVPADTVPATASTGPAGLAGVYVEDGAANLVSMWVRPAARGLGAGKALVEAAAAWAKANDFGALFLWVTESNTSARRLYEGCGFTPTGKRQPLPSDPALTEIAMSRTL